MTTIRHFTLKQQLPHAKSSLYLPIHNVHTRKRSRTVRNAVEDDPRYSRVDSSDLHAFLARKRFAQCVQKGESGINLAEAALAIGAEDDALVSHSTVQLPIDSFLKRIRNVSSELARTTLPGLGSDASPEQALQVVQDTLFVGKRAFRIPNYGRSNLPANHILDHAGVYEQASHAYLHEVLIRKTGIPATLAIVYSQVMQDLLASSAVDFAVRIDCSDWDKLPVAKILHGLPRHALFRPDGSILNTCTSAALEEMLLFLKRAFWPFPWTTRTGQDAGSGFAGAVKVALEGESSAELQAISRTAKHRLDRGIWTSTGAGDMRRALAASERLCMLAGETSPWQRRDTAVLLFHVGQLDQAACELDAYVSTSHFRTSTFQDRQTVEKLMAAIRGHPGLDGKECTPISVDSVLRQTGAPESRRLLPLTW